MDAPRNYGRDPISPMNISSRCEYACRAILELALNGREEVPVTVQAIAEKRNIPGKYLVHILIQLKRAGLVRSIRGAQGGYLLCKSPETITLLDIVEAIEGPILEPLPLEDDAGKDLEGIWKEAAKEICEVLRACTLRDMIDHATQSDMYYI